jgi:hypothetical protein
VDLQGNMDCLNTQGVRKPVVLDGGNGGHESPEAIKGMKQLLSVQNLHNIKMLKT